MTEHLYKELHHPEQANRACKPLLKHIPKLCPQNPAAAGKSIVQERFCTSLLQPRPPALTHVKTLEFFIIKKNPQRFSIIYFRHLFWNASERLLPASPHQRRTRSPRGSWAFQAHRIGLQLSAMLSRFGSHYCLPLA